MEEKSLKSLPIIGKKYPFFDDGKVSFSRLYIATVKRIIPFEELENTMVDAPNKEWREGWGEDPSLKPESLLTLWQEDVEHLNWIFNTKTDYIVEAEVKDDIVETQYFARTKNYGWFSLGCGRCDVGGRLDVDLEYIKNLEELDEKEYKKVLRKLKE